MWDGERAELSGTVGFVLQSSVIFAWTWKKVEREKTAHTGPLFHFYGNLRTIIIPCHSLSKDLCWWGVRHCGTEERACCILSPQLSQKETEWMNPNKITPISLVITGDSVVNTHLWWTEPVPVKQPAESGFGYVLLQQYQLQRLSSQQTCVSPDCQSIGIKTATIQGWAISHWIK